MKRTTDDARPTHVDVLTLDLTFRVEIPVEAAISERELIAALLGQVERTEHLPARKVQKLCDDVDRGIGAAWFTDGKKFNGVDIRISGVEEREVKA